MGRLHRLLSSLPSGEWRQNSVDYRRMKALFRTLLDTKHDPELNKKKYRLFWSVMRSEGDRFAQQITNTCEPYIVNIDEQQWDAYLQQHIDIMAAFFIGNILALAKVLTKYQDYMLTLPQEDPLTQERRHQLTEFLLEQWVCILQYKEKETFDKDMT
jgi:hypothetical protein